MGKSKRKLGDTFQCSICGNDYVMRFGRQILCDSEDCKYLNHVINCKRNKKTTTYKNKASAYGKKWYLTLGGKEWLAKWRKRNRDKLNTNQRLKRYGRAVNKKGARAEAIKLGYRSMSEVLCAEDLHNRGIDFLYEPEFWVWEPDPRLYAPDFKVYKKSGESFYIEYKGRLTVNDRSKLLTVRSQHPDMDIRLIFDNCRKKIYKGSKTTYGTWATNNDYLWAEKTIPPEWMQEGG